MINPLVLPKSLAVLLRVFHCSETQLYEYKPLLARLLGSFFICFYVDVCKGLCCSLLQPHYWFCSVVYDWLWMAFQKLLSSLFFFAFLARYPLAVEQVCFMIFDLVATTSCSTIVIVMFVRWRYFTHFRCKTYSFFLLSNFYNLLLLHCLVCFVFIRCKDNVWSLVQFWC